MCLLFCFLRNICGPTAGCLLQGVSGWPTAIFKIVRCVLLKLNISFSLAIIRGPVSFRTSNIALGQSTEPTPEFYETFLLSKSCHAMNTAPISRRHFQQDNHAGHHVQTCFGKITLFKNAVRLPGRTRREYFCAPECHDCALVCVASVLIDTLAWLLQGCRWIVYVDVQTDTIVLMLGCE